MILVLRVGHRRTTATFASESDSPVRVLSFHNPPMMPLTQLCRRTPLHLSNQFFTTLDIHVLPPLCCFDEGLRDLGNDCIAVTAQSSHTGGSPINQRGCAGFNWPELSIAASEPISVSPEAVSRIGCVIAALAGRSCGEPFRSISDIAPPVVRTFFVVRPCRFVSSAHPLECRP